jgi:RimJ/RimL family protein N-acetyltransferase
MEAKIRALIADYARRKSGAEPLAVRLRAADPWHLALAFSLPGGGRYEVRNVRADDLGTFLAFSAGLSAASQEFFRPYPWDDPSQLPVALAAAIDQAAAHTDACYFLLHDGAPVGEFFLWKAGGNPDSPAQGLKIPELGVGLADAYHGRGLGGFCVRLLNIVAGQLQADAVELTTTLDNAAGFHTYLNAGYEYTGDIANPLEVDVTAVVAGRATAERWRSERQMIYIINRGRRAEILAYLAAKRAQMAALAGINTSAAPARAKSWCGSASTLQ